MLQRRIFLAVTFFLSLAAVSVSLFFSDLAYKTLVWPYILIILGFNFFRHLFFILGAFLEDRKNAHRETKIYGNKKEFTPRVSIIVPAYNESAMIATSLGHLANLHYPNYEIIVVDDGSRDDTFSVATTAAALYPQVDIKVLTKFNGGKSEALNFGFLHASGALILGMDADSRLHPDSLLHGVQHFRNQRVGAVAGYVEIENPEGLLEDFQQLEYMVSLNFTRKAYSFLGIVPIVPGPVGLFRREALDEVRGLTPDREIFAEDAELSLRLIAADWQIQSEEKMIAYTEAPSDLKSFMRQRYRWNRGVFQSLAKNFMSMVASKSHLSRFLAVHLYIEIWLLPLINILLIFNFMIRLLIYNEIHFFTVWIAFGIFLDIWLLIAATLRQKRFLWGVATLTLSKMFYEYLLFFWKMYCLFDEWREETMTWDKLDRRSNLNEVTDG
jgi:poly-beta-1,6-N-acetyl-D-glucosamine synthase